MTNYAIHTLTEIQYLAEGSVEHDLPEPSSPFKTSTVPAIRGELDIQGPSAETGTSETVGVPPEGKGKNDTQDASPVGDEAKPAPEKALEAALGHAPSVLIVEDATELAEVIQATLERMNMITAHETHGAKALARFSEMKPDVVLLDISLPDMTGWKILDTIKEQQEQNPAAKMPAVIVITAYGDPANRLVAKLQGVHSYLIKPFTPDEVEKVVTTALGSAAR